MGGLSASPDLDQDPPQPGHSHRADAVPLDEGRPVREQRAYQRGGSCARGASPPTISSAPCLESISLTGAGTSSKSNSGCESLAANV